MTTYENRSEDKELKTKNIGHFLYMGYCFFYKNTDILYLKAYRFKGGKNMKKRAVALIVTLTTVCSLLSGCGGNGDTGNENNQKETSESELNVILPTGHGAFKDAIEQYMKDNPDVKVYVQEMPTDEFSTVIKTKFASGDAPDIFPVFSGDEAVSFYENGYLEDLSDMEGVVSRISEGADATLRTDDGALYGLPIEIQLILGYYNKDMFEEYQLEVPKTWNDFLDVCQTFKDNGITPISLGHKDLWVAQMIPYGLNATKVQVKDPTFYEGTADGISKFSENEGFLDTLNKYQELINKGYVQEGSLSTTSDQQYEMFVREEVAMTFSGTWGNQSIETLNPQFEVGGFQIPGDEGEQFGASASINGGYGIYAKSKNIDLAKDLLEYMVSPEVLAEYLKDKGPAPYKDVQVDLKPAIKECYEMEAGQPLCQFDNIYWAPGVQEVFLKGVQEMVAGTKQPMDILKSMDEATEKANK